MIICLGPCCIPVHLLLAFLVGLLHNRGYMLWFKKEWVTYKPWARPCPPQAAGLAADRTGGRSRAAAAGRGWVWGLGGRCSSGCLCLQAGCSQKKCSLRKCRVSSSTSR